MTISLNSYQFNAKHLAVVFNMDTVTDRGQALSSPSRSHMHVFRTDTNTYTLCFNMELLGFKAMHGAPRRLHVVKVNAKDILSHFFVYTDT